MNCKQAKTVDLAGYLASLNYFPARIRGDQLYYLSPLRTEREPSFHIDRAKNLFYDHGGDGVGGTIIDFGILYHKCSVREFLGILDIYVRQYQIPLPVTERLIDSRQKENSDQSIKIISAKPITSGALLAYLQQRMIPFAVANEFCCEVTFQLYKREYYGIGFKNDKGGYEIRNPFFKGSSSPKAPSFFDRGFDQVEVFEGFFSFLSFLVVQKNWVELPVNFLVLNTLSFLKKSRPVMEKHRRIHMHLDKDSQGLKRALEVLTWGPQYRRASVAYRNCKDWNSYLVSSDRIMSCRSISYQRKNCQIVRSPFPWRSIRSRLPSQFSFVGKDLGFHWAWTFL